MRDLMGIILLVMGVIIGVMVFQLLNANDLEELGQLKRDEQKAKVVEEYNPLVPLNKAVQYPLDKILPFQFQLSSQLATDEQMCWQECRQQYQINLKECRSPASQGRAADLYRKCQEDCPQRAAEKANIQMSPFDIRPSGESY